MAFSCPMVLGSVGRPASRSAWQRACQCASCALSGSTARAKRKLASVYSWPQHTRVSSGSAASASSEASICAGVPSNTRPQPPENSASPQNSSGALTPLASTRSQK